MTITPKKELQARAELKELVGEKPFIKGSLVKRMITCGTPNCRCTKGKKHIAHYLGIRYKGKRQMLHIPKDWVPVVQEWVSTYKEISKLIEVVSATSIQKVMRNKTVTE